MAHYLNRELLNISEIIDGKLYDEEWRDIIGFEKMYQVSSFGRVKALYRKVKNKHFKEKICAIHQFPNGYIGAKLWKNNTVFNKLVHRLVAESFLVNIYNLPEVNHIYGVKNDNFYLHLEWVSRSDNQKHSFDKLGRKSFPSMKGKFGKLHPNSKPVFCPTLQIGFESSRIAERELGISQGTISDICRGKQLQRDGLVFNFI